jgi:hypothetical protein
MRCSMALPAEPSIVSGEHRKAPCRACASRTIIGPSTNWSPPVSKRQASILPPPVKRAPLERRPQIRSENGGEEDREDRGQTFNIFYSKTSL